MDQNVKDIRSFICRRLEGIKRSDNVNEEYKKGYMHAMSMIQSYIDRTIKERSGTEKNA